jgi:hypothetical protein
MWFPLICYKLQEIGNKLLLSRSAINDYSIAGIAIQASAEIMTVRIVVILSSPYCPRN